MQQNIFRNKIELLMKHSLTVLLLKDLIKHNWNIIDTVLDKDSINSDILVIIKNNINNGNSSRLIE